MSWPHENGVCNFFFTLSIKNVNVITGCERLHILNRSFSCLIVYVKSTNWDRVFLVDFWFNGCTISKRAKLCWSLGKAKNYV